MSSPNVMVERINMAIEDRNWKLALLTCEDLETWLKEGGHKPTAKLERLEIGDIENMTHVDVISVHGRIQMWLHTADSPLG